ncbi:hypothetical protein [Fastidiosipila sanguinis]|uniref:Uncharacterized protein n=1 Tax=Fastidiosipila sanguinis TaxID=236753 RepID=A0A2S0KM43_9FIRM|nr:hypothetical protein [Fastidiosipila sanguinis]AVM42096.1 hypothetical protein C5Q98_02100 [Fastidiosipila sanguinis]
MTNNATSNLEKKEILLEDIDEYAYLIEESEIFIENKEDDNGKKLFYCNKNFIGAVQDAESERLLKQLISDLVNFANIDNISIRFLFVSEAVELFEYIESEFAKVELSVNRNEVETNIKFYFSEDSLKHYMDEKLLDITQLKKENIEILSSRAIASLLMISDVVTLT